MSERRTKAGGRVFALYFVVLFAGIVLGWVGALLTEHAANAMAVDVTNSVNKILSGRKQEHVLSPVPPRSVVVTEGRPIARIVGRLQYLDGSRPGVPLLVAAFIDSLEPAGVVPIGSVGRITGEEPLVVEIGSGPVATPVRARLIVPGTQPIPVH